MMGTRGPMSGPGDVMKLRRWGRRQFLHSSLILSSLGLVAGCGPIPPWQWLPAKVHRIGYLTATSGLESYDEAFRQALHALNYVEGQNLVIEFRFAAGRVDRMPDLVAELLGLEVEVLAVVASVAAVAAKAATSRTPIVFMGVADPVGTGLVASLAHPGGNLTGETTITPILAGKRLEQLQQTVADLSRIALVWDTANRAGPASVQETELAARTLGLEVQPFGVGTPADLESAFDSAAAAGASALIVILSPFMMANRFQIVDIANRRRLPVMYGAREFVEAGGLMAYAPNLLDVHRRAAAYVDKILKGAKPADLPVEQPTTFDFVINLKTAQALGLTIPQAVVQQATELVQ